MSTIEFLSQRASLAHRMLRHCELCEHRCRVDRVSWQLGFCGADGSARVWRYWVDYAEESSLTPSLLVYLSGCNLRCDFCISEASALDACRGVLLTSDWLEVLLDWGVDQGARTLQWIGGEPTIHVPAILEVLAGCRRRLPIVWKSNFFGAPETWQLLDSVVDTYVADFKFGNDACAERIAGVQRYVEIVTRNLIDVASRGSLIVRHLLLPGHERCCLLPILGWLREWLPKVPLSIRDGYLPCWRVERHAELGRPLRPDEGPRALRLAADFGLNVVS
jgi:putative pyruvate formate lyase activating enzyme